jgi:tetratricopeptide (TPR) repeat protein
MRSVEPLARVTLMAAAFAALMALGGCAAVSEPFKAIQQSMTGAASVAPSTAAAPAAKQAPIGPATQRAFDDAARALRAGRTDEAERAFLALAQANPELGGPHANLGVIYRQAGKLDQAAAELEQAIQLSPKQPLYFNQLGVTYRQQGRFEKARDAYERAIALDANYAAPQLNLGILNDLYLNDSARALACYDRYLALSPEGDATVVKWVAELKNRKPTTLAAARKEKS